MTTAQTDNALKTLGASRQALSDLYAAIAAAERVATTLDKDYSVQRIADLERWLQWCLDNCDESPEWNFGAVASNKMRALLRGQDVGSPSVGNTLP